MSVSTNKFVWSLAGGGGWKRESSECNQNSDWPELEHCIYCPVEAQVQVHEHKRIHEIGGYAFSECTLYHFTNIFIFSVFCIAVADTNVPIIKCLITLI
jgi:hypothetical protein